LAQAVKIKSIDHLTHDVLKIVAEKPGGLIYVPGQAVDLSVNKPGWENTLSPFTFTSLPEEDHIEFNIKTYPSRHRLTSELLTLHPGDELLLGEVFGDIHYQGDGIFIAGGAGITPFIAIFKGLEKNQQLGNNKLIFANKTKADIIREDWFQSILGSNFINILSDEKLAGYEHGFISKELIQRHMDESIHYYYYCGPDPMMDAVDKILAELEIPKSSIIREGF
jgi:ferredoxin-NADP reductase